MRVRKGKRRNGGGEEKKRWESDDRVRAGDQRGRVWRVVRERRGRKRGRRKATMREFGGGKKEKGVWKSDRVPFQFPCPSLSNLLMRVEKWQVTVRVRRWQGK
jgi:hypothetical protein